MDTQTVVGLIHRRLNFQLPQRFKLRYNTGEQATKNAEGEEASIYDTPVMVHRAIYGSLERFTAILTEHFAGKWYLYAQLQDPCLDWTDVAS